MRKNFSANYRYLGTRPQVFASPVLGRKSFKYIGFDGCQIRPISLLEAPEYYVYVFFNNFIGITITSSTNRTVLGRVAQSV